MVHIVAGTVSTSKGDNSYSPNYGGWYLKASSRQLTWAALSCTSKEFTTDI